MKRVICLFLIVLCSISIVSAETYTRKEMQDFVLSTALSYYNNNTNADYEQYSMNKAKNFSWSNFNVSPEGISRSRVLNTSCAAFSTICYDYSLGFKFSDAKYKKYVAYSTEGKDSTDFDFIYYNLGYGPSTDYYAKIGKNFQGINGGIVAYYHDVPLDSNYNYVESQSEIKKQLEIIKKTFQPGDILIARRKNKKVQEDGTYTYEDKGHAMVYVGNLVNSNEKGFIHSTGIDLKHKDKDPIQLGVDSQGIIYSNYDAIQTSQLYTTVVSNGVEKKTTSITILRPINEYCGNSDTCNIPKLNNNTKARAAFMKLKYEQYLASNHTLGYDYSSINYYDDIKYYLTLKYGGKEFKEITIKAPIPKYSTLVSCTVETKDKNGNTITDKFKCTSDSDYVYWKNVIVNSSYTESTFKIIVTNKNKSEIVFNGYEIVKGNNKLQLDKFTTKVNPTLKNADATKLRENYKKYSGNNSLNYISNIYKGLYNIDISYLTYDNIKSAIFVNNKRRTTASSKNLSGNSKNIDQMLVPGFYGGTYAEGNTRLDRIRNIDANLVEPGDILVTYKDNKNNAYLYTGYIKEKYTDKDGKEKTKYCSTFVSLDSNKSPIIHDCNDVLYSSGKMKKQRGFRLLKESHTNDYFVVLRPTRVYGNTIVYNFNGQTNKQVSNKFAYKTYGDLIQPTAKGYTFDGWYKESNFKTKISSTTKIDGDSKTYTVYAKWILKDSKVTIKHWKQKVDGNASVKDENNYKLVKTESKVVKVNEKITPETLTYEGFKAPSTQTVTVDSTGKQVVNYYYTRNSYKLSLKSGTGIKSVSGAGTYLYGSSVTIDAVVKDGYTFKNWTDGNDVVSSKKQYTFTRAAAVRTFTANAEANTYTITFDRQSGRDGTSTSKVKYNSSLSKITIPTRDGYSFNGYYKTTDTSGTKYYDSKGEGVKKYDIVGNTTLYANWKANKYTVSYNANGGTGTMSSSSHTYGVKKALTENAFTKTGYNFLGWSKDKDATKASYSDKQEVSSLTTVNNGTVTLYAIWSAKTDISYKVVHYKQNIKDDDYYVGEREYLSGTANSTVTPNVKTYTGFKTPSTKTVTIKADGSTVVKYYYKRVSSHVYLVKGLGIKSVSGEGTYKYWDLFTISAEVKEGYTFVNWTNNDTGEVLTKQQTVTYNRGASDKTYKANARANTYKVDYNGNGATSGSMDSSTFTYDSKGNLKENKYKRNKYNFLGWSNSKESNEVVYKDKQEVLNLTNVDNDTITLYAVWEEKAELESIDVPREEVVVEIPVELPVEPVQPIYERPVIEYPVETKSTGGKTTARTTDTSTSITQTAIIVSEASNDSSASDNKTSTEKQSGSKSSNKSSSKNTSKTKSTKKTVIIEELSDGEEDERVILTNPDELVGLSTVEKAFGMKFSEMKKAMILIVVISVIAVIFINIFGKNK